MRMNAIMPFRKEGMTISTLADNGMYFFERYGCPRFTTHDAEGNIVLDIGYFVK